MASSDVSVVFLTAAYAEERIAEIDGILDVFESNDEFQLRDERAGLVYLLTGD